MTVKPCFVPPPISPVPEGLHRPLWSVMIPTFNCASYLRQTLESVLEQDPGPEQMEIEVVDDCSTKDDPEAVVHEVGKGRVGFHRKPLNEGSTANFNTCIERSTGHLVHILHGDDYVLQGFYSEILNLRARFPEARLFGSRLFGVDETGILLWISSRLTELESGGRSAASFYYGSQLQFCSVVIRREFFTEFGGFMPTLVHTADWEMWTRAISLGGGIVSSKVLACYRVFATNETGRFKQTGENIRDCNRLNDCLAARFPDFDRARAGEMLARRALKQAHEFGNSGNEAAVAANLEIHRELMPPASFPLRLRRKIQLLRQALNR